MSTNIDTEQLLPLVIDFQKFDPPFDQILRFSKEKIKDMRTNESKRTHYIELESGYIMKLEFKDEREFLLRLYDQSFFYGGQWSAIQRNIKFIRYYLSDSSSCTIM